jgi:uncharacterized MAPEG superfamily protein
MKFTLAYWCVLVAALLPIFCAGIGKWGTFGKPRKEGGFDNHDPRQWWAKQSGARARANAAQHNTFEALPFFFVAVVIAHQLRANQTLVDLLAFAWVFVRCMYVLLYIADVPKARSAVWFLALIINIAILLLGVRA